MPTAPWNTATLRIASKTLTSIQVGACLGATASKMLEKGIPLSPKNPESHITTESLWLLDSSVPSDANLVEHIDELTKFLEIRTPQFQKLQSACTTDIFCGVRVPDQFSLLISSTLMSRLAVLNVDVVFDMYGNDF